MRSDFVVEDAKPMLRSKKCTDYATLEKIDDVSVLSLDDGKVNVFSIEMLEAINNCLNDVPKDSGSLVIKGKEGIFSAGFDLKTLHQEIWKKSQK